MEENRNMSKYEKNMFALKNKELLTLISDKKGTNTRLKILDAILIQPSNANQIANKLNLDYKTITYHMAIICEYGYATKETLEKTTYYFPSQKLIKNMEEYNTIKKLINKKHDR